MTPTPQGGPPAPVPLACFHCHTPVPPGVRIDARVDGTPRPMCCHGCAAVAEAIEAAGLTDFYRQRAEVGAPPGAPPIPAGVDFAVYDDPRLWPGFVGGGEDGPAEVSLLLEGVTCQACLWLNERRLARLPGVRQVQANYATRRLRVSFDGARLPLSRILATVAELGYRATPFDEARALGALARERRSSLIRVGLAGLFSSQVMMLAFGLYSPDDLGQEWAPLFNATSALLSLPVVTWCAWPFYAGALRDLQSRRLGMDVPVALGVLAAFFGSVHAALAGGPVWWDSATMFVFLLLTGRHLELLARSGAESASLELARMTPAVAHRLVAGPAPGEVIEADVPVAALAVGDRLRVRPGEAVPVDGTVLAGRSSVDQALFTGEGMPVAKGPGDAVVGGTQNLEGPLEMRVDAIGEATLLAGLGRLLERAQGGKSRVTELADRHAGWFVAAVLLLAVAVLVEGLRAGSDSALARAIAVLVATCPCALSLATPATVVAATSRWFRLGLLATRPHAVEALARARHFVFDKTGTLTEGRPTLVATRTRGGLDAAAALSLAASLAQASEHPLSRAIVAAAGTTPRAAAEDLQSIPGGGLTGTVAGHRLALGSPAFVREALGIDHEALGIGAVPGGCEAGDTAVVLAGEAGAMATFALRDRLREGAEALVRGLLADGCRVSLFTGDAEAPAQAVAARLGIADVACGLSPAAKLARLRALTADGTPVAMVGDGVNDAPVLAAATVSVAMGQGTALARSAADAIFLGNDLTRLLEARATSRRSLIIIRENLLWALAWNVGVLPAAAGGWLSAWFAALGMSMSSLLVVLNAMRVARGPEAVRTAAAAGATGRAEGAPPGRREDAKAA